MRLILAMCSLLIICFTIVYYLLFKKEVNSNKRMSDKVFKSKMNTFSVLTVVSIVLGIISVAYNIYYSFSTINENNDIKRYNEYVSYIKSYDDAHSDLSFFPKEVDKSNVVNFYNYNKNGFKESSYFVLLSYKYDEENVTIEEDRIKSISTYEMNRDNDKVYIISDNGKGNKEYVIVKDNIITYVFNQLFKKDDLDIDKSYFIE